jgi:quercetin dioxygenase-like cupin family protein
MTQELLLKEQVLPLQTAVWANVLDNGTLSIDPGPRAIQMANSGGTGLSLVSHAGFGADVIRFAAGRGVQNHTHPGDHILFVLVGRGFLTYAGSKHELYPGLCYFVPGSVDHAIDATENLVMIAVGNLHKPVGSVERMTPVPNRA